jgi:hypothetical protein
MNFKVKLMFLGAGEPKESKKSGNTYYLPKFMEMKTNSIFEFYVPSDKIQLVTDMAKVQPMTETEVILSLTSFNNKPQVDLAGFGK